MALTDQSKDELAKEIWTLRIRNANLSKRLKDEEHTPESKNIYEQRKEELLQRIGNLDLDTLRTIDLTWCGDSIGKPWEDQLFT